MTDPYDLDGVEHYMVRGRPYITIKGMMQLAERLETSDPDEASFLRFAAARRREKAMERVRTLTNAYQTPTLYEILRGLKVQEWPHELIITGANERQKAEVERCRPVGLKITHHASVQAYLDDLRARTDALEARTIAK